MKNPIVYQFPPRHTIAMTAHGMREIRTREKDVGIKLFALFFIGYMIWQCARVGFGVS